MSRALTDNPDLEAIWAYKFFGVFMVMAIPVSTSFRVFGGRVVFSEEYRS